MAGPAAAGKLIRLLDRNALSVLQMTRATRWQINRRLCTKPPEGSAPKPSVPKTAQLEISSHHCSRK
ncbi:UNVERIFIED_CONTAM: hypothetical protein K2H54_019093 [Gekko kuhli]